MLKKEADVVIVGYGGAGSAAAITAHDAGAKVIVLEKNAEGGGSTKTAGGSIREYLDLEKAVTYFEGISFETVPRGVLQAFVEESAVVPQWLHGIGGEVESLDQRGPQSRRVVFSCIPGSDGIGGRLQVLGSGRHGGNNLWMCLSRNVVDRKIEVLFRTSGKQLIKDERGIIGVIADGPGGEIRVKARRAVILTCGGFEYNADMQRNYLGVSFLALGNPGNTGDGINMALEVGADLWHMSGLSCAIGYKVPEFDIPFMHWIRKGGYLYADQEGSRFIDEAGTDIHSMAEVFAHLDRETLTFPRIPSYVIFDENTRQAGPIAFITGWAREQYEWSIDNSAEIKRGWIKKADTIADLALQIGLKPQVVQATVGKYNISCAGGYDPEFGRSQLLVPLNRPPYYAIAICPALINTQGGPRRNAKGQVLNTHRQPISRLYSAGELGSIWGIAYPGAGNVTECLAFGRIAGRNAAAEKPWKE